MKTLFALLFATVFTMGGWPNRVTAAEKASVPNDGLVQWISFPDPRLELRGLPWFAVNAPDLWRLPQTARAQIPNGAWARAVAPDGGRIRFSADTAELRLRVEVKAGQRKPAFFDAYVGEEFAGSAKAASGAPAELVLFRGRKGGEKPITIYLPNNTEARVLAVGVDPKAALRPAPAFAAKLSLVCYGSSVLQGTGADHPGKTYPAIVARRLNLDFVNLGFGGAGKAEPAVVDLVSEPPASCYLFDLGKSYGNQSEEPFVRMLATIRSAHPTTPIIVVTPIYSTKEPGEKEYREKSVSLRAMMRKAGLDRRAAGDRFIAVAEGLELFGPDDQALFRDPQHPNDEGNERLAARLAPLVQRLITGRD